MRVLGGSAHREVIEMPIIDSERRSARHRVSQVNTATAELRLMPPCPCSPS